MSALEQEYEGRVTFAVIAPELGPDGDLLTIEEYPQVGTHGIVALSPEGTVTEFIKGHNFGREEIEAVLGRLLADT